MAVCVLAAGGTGGHVFPAVAVAEALLDQGVQPLLITDKRSLSLKPAFANLDGKMGMEVIAASSPSGNIIKKLTAIIKLSAGTVQAAKLLKRHKPFAVVGFGGYPSFPTLVAARALNIPIILHEQNAVLGKANRSMANMAKLLALSFPNTAQVPAEAKTVVTGNPIRGAIGELQKLTYTPPGGTLNLLVVGGSLGAKVFGRILPEAINTLDENDRKKLRLVQQAKAEDVEQLKATYAELGVEAEIAPFFNDMPARLAWSHAVIARSGASTIFELLLAGRPSLLVPYPYAADNHQHANAKALAEGHAATLLEEEKVSPAKLGGWIRAAIHQPGMLAGMAEKARRLATPDAARNLAALAMECLQK
ncbi:undecaprenyldiphospho-muramoylpentapeptide beta-N-acetylglucosaminyltransferase [bacterium]|nr:undecaprenyldiphospho-muramoylpentapeptide beta-N-acetylglucosaminyltransferase [bacterium]